MSQVPIFLCSQQCAPFKTTLSSVCGVNNKATQANQIGNITKLNCGGIIRFPPACRPTSSCSASGAGATGPFGPCRARGDFGAFGDCGLGTPNRCQGGNSAPTPSRPCNPIKATQAGEQTLKCFANQQEGIIRDKYLHPSRFPRCPIVTGCLTVAQRNWNRNRRANRCGSNITLPGGSLTPLNECPKNRAIPLLPVRRCGESLACLTTTGCTRTIVKPIQHKGNKFIGELCILATGPIVNPVSCRTCATGCCPSKTTASNACNRLSLAKPCCGQTVKSTALIPTLTTAVPISPTRNCGTTRSCNSCR